jgi:2-isopropylmalate synthase
MFEETYLEATRPFKLESFRAEVSRAADRTQEVSCIAQMLIDGTPHELRGRGNGPIDAFVRALGRVCSPFTLVSYAEHSLERGSGAQAVAYIQIETAQGRSFFGAAIDTNIEWASIKAVLSAVNRAIQARQLAEVRPEESIRAI